MPAVFQQALAPPQQPQAAPAGPPDMFAPWVDPNAAQLAALQAKLDAPAQPTFSPEQIKQRQDDNARQYALGLLGQLSGNQQLGEVGGTVFKQALANRQPKYTDHGTYDPLTGEFNYSPDYLHERDQTQYNMVANRSAAQQNNYMMNQQRLMERQQQAREMAASRERNAFVIAGGGGLGAGQPAQIGSSPEGWPVFRDKQGRLSTIDTNGQPVVYQGAVSPKESNANPTQDENVSAGWRDAMAMGIKNMQQAMAEDPKAALPSTMETLAGLTPHVGDDLANAERSGPRQRFVQGQMSFTASALHMLTGAGFGIEEAKSMAREVTPRWGEDAATIAQKQATLEMYLGSATRRAGKALTAGTRPAGPAPGQPAVSSGAPAAAAPPAAASDPWGVRSRLFPGH